MRKWTPITLVICIACLALSCSQQNRALAKIGSQKITLAQFEEVYRPQPGLIDSGAVLEQKKKLLDQMVEQHLLAIAGREKGLGKDSLLKSNFEDMKKNILLGQLYKMEIQDRAKPNDGEIRSYYKRMGTEIKASHILVKTEPEARDILKQLKSGTAFEELARQKSMDPGSGQQGGSLGWFGWGRMVEDFQKAAFDLKPGQVSKPVETPFGFHIIRLDSVRPVELQPLDQMKERIIQQLSMSKPRELTTKYLAALKKQADIKIEAEVLSQIAAKQAPPQPGMPPALPTLSAEELKRTIVRFRGGSWSVGQFYDNATKYLGGAMDLTNQDMVKRQVEGILTSELLLQRAKAKGLEQQPQVKTQLERAWNDLLAGSIYRDEIQSKVTVAEAEVKSYYQQHKQEFYQPAQAFVNIIAVKTRPEADEIYGLLARGTDFGKLARERSIDWTKGSGGALGNVVPNDPNFPEVSQKAFAMPLNQVSRPFVVRDGYAVIKVTDKKPGLQRTLDQVKMDIDARIRRSLEDSLYQQLVGQLKNKYPVTIDQGLLAAAGNKK